MASNFVGRDLVANIVEQNVTLDIAFINLVVNYSANVATLCFDVAGASATETLVLKAGESRQNLAVPFTKLYYSADVDASAVRIEGLTKAEF